MHSLKSALLPAAAGVLLALGCALPDAAQAKGVRFQCSDQLGRQNVTATAKFERDGARRKFAVEFEAGFSTAFHAGDVLKVRVEDPSGALRLVGQFRVVRGARQLVGALRFDTVPQANARPFPANFPATVGAGTEVQVGGQLSCALQAR
ncbi:MAG: hypothetical protein U1E17_07480 [Geminicoccaceae bacterium]